MKQNKETLKTYFKTGDKPTQNQYANLIDSFLHKDEELLYVAKPKQYNDNSLLDNQLVYVNSPFKDIQPIIKIGGQEKNFVDSLRFFDCMLKISEVGYPDNFAIYKINSIGKNYVHYASWSGFDLYVDHLVSSGKMHEDSTYKLSFIITGSKNPYGSYYYYNGTYIGDI